MFSIAGLMISGLGDDAVASHQVALESRVGRLHGAVGRRAGDHGACGQCRRARRPFCHAPRRSRRNRPRHPLPGLLCHSDVRRPSPPCRDLHAGSRGLTGAVALLHLAAIFQIFDGLQVAANGALRGLKDTRVPLIATALAYSGIGIPLGWYLGLHGGLGARGVWMGLIAGLAAAACLLLLRFDVLSRRLPGRHSKLALTLG